MATHSSILALKIPWTEEPGRLQSMGWQSQTRLKLLRMGNVGIPVADSFRYLAKLIQYCKV